MRIAMLTNNYKPFVGGVPISIERLALGLRNLGHQVYVFAPSYGKDEEESFVIRYRSRKKKLNGELTVPKFYDPDIERHLLELNIDIIHTHHPVISGYLACYLGKKYHIPVVFTYHTRYEQYIHYFKPFKHINGKSKWQDYGEKMIMFHNKIFTNQCDMILAPTPGIRNYLIENGTTTETQGIVVLEAMAAGLPVIAVNASGVRDVVENGVNGYLTEEDRNEWAEKLMIVSTNTTVYENMRIEAKKKALKYTASSIAERAAEYYRSAIHSMEMGSYYEKKTI